MPYTVIRQSEMIIQNKYKQIFDWIIHNIKMRGFRSLLKKSVNAFALQKIKLSNVPKHSLIKYGRQNGSRIVSSEMKPKFKIRHLANDENFDGVFFLKFGLKTHAIL
jgi:hypothetical protein